MISPKHWLTLAAFVSLSCAAHSTRAPASAPPRPQTPAAEPVSKPTQPRSQDCPRAPSLDSQAIEREVLCLLQHYIRIDTTNPPGNELRAARFLEQVLAREGIRAEVVEAAPGRANLMARLPGKNEGKALVLMHHMDVVPASTTEWSVPPLSGEVRDGQVWGRGSLDNKGGGIVELVAFLLCKRLGLALDRDLVFLAVADEESGGAYGARWLMQHRRSWLEGVEFVLNEGGAIVDLGEGQLLYSVEFAQKAPLWLRVSAQGNSGHGSTPNPDSAANVLVRALARLEQYRFPIVVLPEVQALFSTRAAAMPEPLARSYKNLAASLQEQRFRDKFLTNPQDAALVQNTLAITMLSGSDKENVVAAEASAVIDVRLLPGQDTQAATEELTRVMAEPALRVQPILSWQAHPAPRDTVLFAAIERVARNRHPGAPVIPNVIAGFTDCNAFRAHGITCYGFLPLTLSLDDIRRIHGKDERIPVETLVTGVRELHALIAELARSSVNPDL